MIILILAILITFCVIGKIIDVKAKNDTGYFICLFSGILIVICLIVALIVGISITETNYVDEKIALYQVENDRIENEISTIVENYKDYEITTFTKIKGKDATTLVTLFPELKSDELVKKQINIYNSNKKKIVSLKEKKINIKPYRWWLYFG